VHIVKHRGLQQISPPGQRRYAVYIDEIDVKFNPLPPQQPFQDSDLGPALISHVRSVVASNYMVKDHAESRPLNSKSRQDSVRGKEKGDTMKPQSLRQISPPGNAMYIDEYDVKSSPLLAQQPVQDTDLGPALISHVTPGVASNYTVKNHAKSRPLKSESRRDRVRRKNEGNEVAVQTIVNTGWEVKPEFGLIRASQSVSVKSGHVPGGAQYGPEVLQMQLDLSISGRSTPSDYTLVTSKGSVGSASDRMRDKKWEARWEEMKRSYELKVELLQKSSSEREEIVKNLEDGLKSLKAVSSLEHF
jgi:hypothetical protein